VIVESGDGCTYGEGGNHFLAALRRNVTLTLIVHDNQVYGLTKGQASPTSDEGFVTKAQPAGVLAEPFNPVEEAVALRAGFVARGFSGMPGHLAGLIREALASPGFSLVDVLQPCVSFNKVNTFAWYRQRVRELPPGYDPRDWELALRTAATWGDEIPVGVIWRGGRPAFEARVPALAAGTLVGRPVDRERLGAIVERLR
jgi:2-oxoglutarate ferredoxin oxidoreductase subunit beta